VKILDNLKKIFETKFRDIFTGNTITLFDFSRNTENVIELKEGNKLAIDISKATEEEKKKLKEEVLDLIVQDQDQVFLMDKSSQKTERIKGNLPTGEDETLLKFYKDKLDPEMYKALEVSFVVRNAFNTGEDIVELKRDIANRFPTFGNNLCNLVTGGYFDNHFKDLYNSMIDDEIFDINSYQKKVKNIVCSLPYTVFITRFKSYDELSGEVRFKLSNLKKYGAGRLLLHGIGRENVNTSNSILDEYKDDGTVTVQKEINPKKTIITATLNF